MSEDLATKVLAQWKSSNYKFCPPITVTTVSIAQRIQRRWDKLHNVAAVGGKWVKVKDKEKVLSELDTLCDICVCPHQIYLCGSPESMCNGCSNKAHITCDCPLENKIPKLELAWVYYQRIKTSEISQTQITSLDKKETKREERKLTNVAQRKDKFRERERRKRSF